MNQEKKYIHCALCDHKVPRNRTDNFERHMRSVHYNKLVECECGKQMRSTSIARHKKNSCDLYKSSSQTEKVKSNEKTDFNQNDPKSNDEPDLKEANLNEPVQLMSIMEQKIEITVRAKTYSNGTVIFEHNEISWGNVSFELKKKRNDDDNTEAQTRDRMDERNGTDAPTNFLHEGKLR